METDALSRKLPRRRRVVAPSRAPAINAPRPTASPEASLAIPVLARLPHLNSAGEVRPHHETHRSKSPASETTPKSTARTSAVPHPDSEKAQANQGTIVSEQTAVTDATPASNTVGATGSTNPLNASYRQRRKAKLEPTDHRWYAKPGVREMLAKSANGTLIVLVVIAIVYLYWPAKRPPESGTPNPSNVAGEATETAKEPSLRQARRESPATSANVAIDPPLTAVETKSPPDSKETPVSAGPTQTSSEKASSASAVLNGYPSTDPRTYRYPAGGPTEPTVPWAPAVGINGSASPYPTTNQPNDYPRTATLRGTIETPSLKVR